ncbi:MAG: cation transporter [Mycobacteriaceae bacterium]|nr:cation transporter [Mycobacteriaceae bacterium]
MDDSGRHHSGRHDSGGHGHAGHRHGVAADADRRWLTAALGLIVAFMMTEVVIGVMATSLALLSDAAHMLTDAAAIVLALIAIRLAARPAGGGYTYGLKRAEILSAQANGITLLLLAAYLGYEGIQRLITPPAVEGPLVLYTALVGIAVNLLATWCISKANRSSLNIEGAYQHILSDMYAFIATAVAGAAVWKFGFQRADALAALLVAALMVKAGWSLVTAAGRILLERAPKDLDPDLIGAQLASLPEVVEVHDLHIWQITSSMPALSAHVLVHDGADCHLVRERIEEVLHGTHGIDHTTLQVDHAGDHPAGTQADHCADPHGASFRA